jgi:hypothetical protein
VAIAPVLDALKRPAKAGKRAVANSRANAEAVMLERARVKTNRVSRGRNMTDQHPKTKPSEPKKPLEEDADPVCQNSNVVGPGQQEIEDAADRVDRPATEPSERTGDLLNKENDLTRKGIVGPEKQHSPSR